MTETVRFKTKDNVDIVGDYYYANSFRGVLLLHMMPADKKSWAMFAEKLVSAGFQALAIDLRGHGESQGGPDGYKKFDDASHQASIHDVQAGAEFLRAHGVTDFSLCGASIGANLSLQYLSEHPEAMSAVLLSPGIDYRGVKTDVCAARLKEPQRVYFVASDEDRYSYESVDALVKNLPRAVVHEAKFYKNAGHGTAIFERQPELVDELVRWISRS